MKRTPRTRTTIDIWTMLLVSARLLAGRRFWIAPFLPLAWSALHVVWLLAGWRVARFGPEDVQLNLVGLPLIVLAIGLGVRIIASQVELGMLEVTYTVPGGARRVWSWQIAAALLMLLIAELLLTLAACVFFTPVPLRSFYGALQGAIFYFMLAMTLGAFSRNVIAASFAALAIFSVDLLVTSFGSVQMRFSPLFNPVRLDADPSKVFAWTVQNWTGFALASALLTALSFARAERREKLLGT